VRVAKAHGLGNDFLLVDRAEAGEPASAWVPRLCDRHAGLGADGVLVYALGSGSVQMRLVNADGTDGDISGNGVRCLAALMVARGWLPPRHVVETPPGPRAVVVESLGARRYRVDTELGVPILDSARIPVALEPPAPRVVEHPIEAAGETLAITASSLGNPHCAVFLETPADDALVARLGPALERHPFFPRRTNVEFVTITARDALRVRFWERGVGPTRASGTGAASAVVATVLTGRGARRARVVCDGGTLEVDWPEGGVVRQVGEVELVFEGRWLGE
jgi:diaminopimelate epimerase